MRKKVILSTALVTFAFPALAIPASAATETECLSLWKSADVNANGALTKDEDKVGYIAAAASAQSLAAPDTLSRDEFVKACQGNTFAGLIKDTTTAATPAPGPAASRDLGKGDLTPSTSALSETDARSKLTASGFKDVQDLRLDKSGIWHATATADGQRKDVAIDAQGDMIPTNDADMSAKVAQAEPAMPKETVKKTPAAGADAVEVTVVRGHPDPAGLPLWAFILVGNALGLFLLSTFTSGGTSAMSYRKENPFV